MRGRWWLLEWFCEQERILSDDELFAALRRQAWREVGDMGSRTASRRRRVVNRRARRMLGKRRG